jgi:hypothetical protein
MAKEQAKEKMSMFDVTSMHFSMGISFGKVSASMTVSVRNCYHQNKPHLLEVF